MSTGLVAALAKAAKDAREEQGISKEAVAAAVGGGVDRVRRFENVTAFGALDALLLAYEETTGVSLIDLLDEAKSNLKKKG